MNTPVYADNCQACGKEHLSIELLPVKLGTYSASRIRVCLGCLIKSDVYEDYKEAAELIMQTSVVAVKTALASVRDAKEQLKKKIGQPSWLRGIGISTSNGQQCVKVNVSSLTDDVKKSVPSEVNGIPVLIEAVGDIKVS